MAIVPTGTSNIVGNRGPSCLLVALNHQTTHNQPRILCLAEILMSSKGGVTAVVDRRGSNKQLGASLSCGSHRSPDPAAVSQGPPQPPSPVSTQVPCVLQATLGVLPKMGLVTCP